MGGGAAMRTVGKVAGIGLVNSGVRVMISEHPVSASTRGVTRPMAVIGAASATETIKPIEAYDDGSMIHKIVCEIDDWDFADFTEETVVGSGDNKLARVVFSGAPTFEEAKEATSELKDVLEKEYFTITASPKFGNMTQDSSLSCLENSEVGQNKACLITQTAGSTNAMQAFKFLNESPAIQTVVASIASDPNVWNSVLGNPTLQDYLQSQKIDFSLQNLYPGDSLGHADKSTVIHETSSQTDDADSPKPHPEDFLTNAWNNTKDAVIEMMNNLSGFFQNLFGGGKVGSDSDATNTSFVEKALGPSIMGLVIMVIMVVVLRRT